MKELVRCRPCGFVIEADKLGEVCPACGLPRKVFEPYRERVSRNRLVLLNFDLHPIAIHLSQALVIAIPILIIMTNLFKQFQPEVLKNVLIFSVFVFPFTLILAIVTGVIDGLTRFKTLATPILRVKIIFSLIILSLSVALFFIAPQGNLYLLSIALSILSLGAGFQLGLWGKKLINVILPGSYPQKKGNKETQPKLQDAQPE
ncbi:MAG: rubredoxin-like domain-containing protein [Bacteroidales bacterium]|jgi:rubredoxin